MAYSCPISFAKTDATLTKISALYVLIIISLGVLNFQVLFFYFIAFDFVIRLFCCKELSIVYQLSFVTKKVLGLKTHNHDAAAKRLAAYFGLTFTLMLIAEYHLGLTSLLLSTAAVFVLCSSLEVVFGYCIGCKIYFFIKKIYPAFME